VASPTRGAAVESIQDRVEMIQVSPATAAANSSQPAAILQSLFETMKTTDDAATKVDGQGPSPRGRPVMRIRAASSPTIAGAHSGRSAAHQGRAASRIAWYHPPAAVQNRSTD
jgi:hypothetical protein